MRHTLIGREESRWRGERRCCVGGDNNGTEGKEDDWELKHFSWVGFRFGIAGGVFLIGVIAD